MENNDVMFGDKSLSEWTNMYPQEETNLSDEQAEKMGILQPEPETQEVPQEESENKLYQMADKIGVEHPDENKEYQKLSVGETLGDIGKTMGAEALKIFAPKENSWLANNLGYSEADLYQHEAETRIGEASKYLYRYGAGTLSFIFGVGKVGAAVKAVGLAKNSTAAIKLGTGIQKLMGAEKLIKTGANASKLAKVGAWLGNAALEGSVAGAMSDFTFYREDEGHLADAFEVTDNPILTYLQSDDNDSEATAKFKNVVEGFIMGIPFGIGIEGAKAAGSYFKSLKKVAVAQTAEEAAEALPEAIVNEAKLQNVLSTSELVDTIKKIKSTADMQGLDAEQMIIDSMNPKNYDDAKEILKTLNDGNDIFIHDDGTFALKIEKWEDAAKVSPEEYKRQLTAMDEDMANYQATNYGDTALSHQDSAVRDTWVNRGWIGENEELTSKTANKVAKNYLDKWQIDNNVKVEFVDGLTIDGKAVEGNTSATKYQGKVTKPKQNAIDKKKLQISKLEDKITQVEGGNKEIADPLDNLKEELRIAKNELTELEKDANKKNRISNITIQIDKNASNPYATLRSELEHARDIAKGTIPDTNVQHFSRYKGMNEAEVAPDYVYKKSKSKLAKTDNYTFKEASSEGFGDNRIEISNSKGQNLGYVEYTIKDNTLSIDEIRNTSKRTNYSTPNVASKLIDNLLNQNPNIKEIKWDAVTPEGMKFKKQYLELHPELQGKTKGISTQEELDLSIEKDYNAREGVLDEGSSRNNGQLSLESRVGESQATNQTEGRFNSSAKSNNDNIGDTLSSNSSTNARGENTSISNETQQLKLDFNSIEEATEKVSTGEFQPKTMGEVDTLVAKTAELDPEISGDDWMALAKDSDKLSAEIKDLLDLEDDSSLKTIFAETQDDIAAISRKQLASTKIISQLLDKIESLGKDVPIEVKKQYVDAIQYLTDYKEHLGSGLGRALNEQKFTNKAVETFGSKRLSQLNKDGIRNFVDLLKESIDDINLQFTRGSLIQKKQALYAKLAELDPNLLSVINEDLEFATKFDNIVEGIIKKPDLDAEQAILSLENIFTERNYNSLLEKVDLAPTKKGMWETIKNWTDERVADTRSYYVHNLLSGVGTLAKNILSGGMNTVYFPAKKILAGFTDPMLSTEQKGVLLREGINTYKNLITTWNESWQLCCQAFLKGDGKLSSIGTDTLNMDESFKGFNEWGFNSFWEGLQNIHSVMTRAMGASDEFMSQLNYRSIARARAMESADKLAQIAGKSNDEAWINSTTDQIFNKYFTADGKPLDVNIYNEAKSILYQNPLSGKMLDPTTGYNYDIRTGKMLDKGEEGTQTAAMKIGSAFQKAANENLLAKFFFPFVKTGTNILQMNLDHNLWYNLASPTQRQILKSSTPEGALLRSQCAFGAFSFGLGTMLAINGMVTGSMPSDAKERKALLATGWKPYSFKVGNTYVSYQGYEPIHTMLGFAADFTNLLTSVNTKEEEDKALKFGMQAGSVFVNNFLDKAAFRTGLRSLSSLFELDERHIMDWKQAMTSPLQGALPDSTMIKNISTIGKRSATAPQTMYERIFNMYFNRGLGEYRRDAFGDKQNIYNAILTSASSQGTDPEYIELNRLAEKGYMPTEIGKVVSGYSLKYKDFKDPETGRNAYDLMQEELSKTDLKDRVRELVTSDYYQQLDDGINNSETKAQGIKWTSSDDTKVNMLNDLFIEYNDIAKEKVLSEYPQLINKEGQTIQEAADNAEIIKMNKQLGNQMSDSAEKLKSLF